MKSAIVLSLFDVLQLLLVSMVLSKTTHIAVDVDGIRGCLGVLSVIVVVVVVALLVVVVISGGCCHRRGASSCPVRVVACSVEPMWRLSVDRRKECLNVV